MSAEPPSRPDPEPVPPAVQETVRELVDLSRCTLESPDLYSHRRDHLESGRQAGVIRMAPS